MEQAEAELETINQEGSVEESQGIGSILSDALTQSQSAAKAGTGTEKAATEQAEVEPPFLELLLDEAKKVPFKNEQEFNQFLDRNKVLKEGWLRQADYTRKTQEISELKKQYEGKFQEEQKVWGQTPPDNASKQALASIWQVYQGVNDPLVSDAISRFVADVQLIAKGQAPVGPLKQGQGATTEATPNDPLKREILELKQQLQQFQGQMTLKERQAVERQQAEQAQKDEQAVDSWITEKEKSGTKFSGEELEVMADIMSVTDAKGQPKYSLDQAHTLALAHLGKTQASIAKTVLKDAKTMNSKTPKPPGSRASSGSEPEPKSIGDIFKQGIKNLA